MPGQTAFDKIQAEATSLAKDLPVASMPGEQGVGEGK